MSVNSKVPIPCSLGPMGYVEFGLGSNIKIIEIVWKLLRVEKVFHAFTFFFFFFKTVSCIHSTSTEYGSHTVSCVKKSKKYFRLFEATWSYWDKSFRHWIANLLWRKRLQRSEFCPLSNLEDTFLGHVVCNQLSMLRQHTIYLSLVNIKTPYRSLVLFYWV